MTAVVTTVSDMTRVTSFNMRPNLLVIHFPLRPAQPLRTRLGWTSDIVNPSRALAYPLGANAAGSAAATRSYLRDRRSAKARKGQGFPRWELSGAGRALGQFFDLTTRCFVRHG